MEKVKIYVGKELSLKINFELRENKWFAEIGEGDSVEERMIPFVSENLDKRSVRQLLNKDYNIRYTPLEELEYLPKANTIHGDEYKVKKN